MLDGALPLGSGSGCLLASLAGDRLSDCLLSVSVSPCLWGVRCAGVAYTIRNRLWVCLYYDKL